MPTRRGPQIWAATILSAIAAPAWAAAPTHIFPAMPVGGQPVSTPSLSTMPVLNAGAVSGNYVLPKNMVRPSGNLAVSGNLSVGGTVSLGAGNPGAGTISLSGSINSGSISTGGTLVLNGSSQLITGGATLVTFTGNATAPTLSQIQNDQLTITGGVNFSSSSLSVGMITAGSYTILTAPGLTGGVLTLGNVSTRPVFNLTQTGNAILINVIDPSTLTGDPTIGNLTLAPTTGDPGTTSIDLSDIDQDGSVDIQDLQTLAAHWQQSVGDGSSAGNDGTTQTLSFSSSLAIPTSTPEPTSIALLSASAIFLLRRRKA